MRRQSCWVDDAVKWTASQLCMRSAHWRRWRLMHIDERHFKVYFGCGRRRRRRHLVWPQHNNDDDDDAKISEAELWFGSVKFDLPVEIVWQELKQEKKNNRKPLSTCLCIKTNTPNEYKQIVDRQLEILTKLPNIARWPTNRWAKLKWYAP